MSDKSSETVEPPDGDAWTDPHALSETAPDPVALSRLLTATEAALGMVPPILQIKPQQTAGKAGEEASTAGRSKGKPAPEKSNPALGLAWRAKRRVDIVEVWRQTNIEAVLEIALGMLPPTAGDGFIDEDWYHRFIEEVARVSCPTMRRVWGRMLARETGLPGGIALATIEVLGRLGIEDISNFARFAGFRINNFVVRLGDQFFYDEGIPLEDLLRLEELGLVRMGREYSKKFTSQSEESYQTHLILGDKILRITHPNPEEVLELPSHRLTRAGVDIARLLDCRPTTDYVLSVVNLIQRKGFKVHHANIISRFDENSVHQHTPFSELVVYGR